MRAVERLFSLTCIITFKAYNGYDTNQKSSNLFGGSIKTGEVGQIVIVPPLISDPFN